MRIIIVKIHFSNQQVMVRLVIEIVQHNNYNQYTKVQNYICERRWSVEQSDNLLMKE